uniref:Uncharacterized protein n=1 Tax=Oryza glumipatula TaxID=40148 RepID=A0A0E0B476_9ORYZ
MTSGSRPAARIAFRSPSLRKPMNLSLPPFAPPPPLSAPSPGVRKATAAAGADCAREREGGRCIEVERFLACEKLYENNSEAIYVTLIC